MSFLTKVLHKLLLLPILVLFSTASFAGSLEDFLVAIHRDDASTIVSLVNRGFDPNSVDEHGEPGLVLAFKLESLHAAQTLMSAPKIKLNATNQVGENALMLASLKGHLAEVKNLLAQGAAPNKSGWTALHYACTGITPHQTDIIDALLRDYAYIDAPSPNGSTPLMMAARYADIAVVKQLLEEGADPELRNQLGLSAIDFANQVHRHDVVKAIQLVIDDTPAR